MRNTLPILAVLLLAGAATVTTLPARAQEYTPAAYGDDAEHVIVQAPRERLHSFADGTVRLSRDIAFDDRDLRTRGGVRALRDRIRDAARDVCDELWDRTTSPGVMVEDSDLRQCASDAYRHAMSQVHDAIAEAREDAYDER
jgi:UrcA family protein